VAANLLGSGLKVCNLKRALEAKFVPSARGQAALNVISNEATKETK